MSEISIEDLLGQYAAPVRALALGARALVRREFPTAVEKVQPGWKAIWYGTGPRMPHQVCVIQPQRAWVNLAFARGAELPDPARLLEGTGKGIRHVKIRSDEQLRSAALRDLIRAALEAAGA